jgi:hypothetical protein
MEPQARPSLLTELGSAPHGCWHASAGGLPAYGWAARFVVEELAAHLGRSARATSGTAPGGRRPGRPGSMGSASITLDRYGHLYPEADQALRDRLDQLYGSSGGGVG